MDQQKIGAFLKTLRKEKGLTQEKFAEIVNVSNRTVSRWENGNNLPDLDIFLQLSDFYDVELRELLDGERTQKHMNQDLEETVIKAVEYTSTEAGCRTRNLHWLFLAGAILWLITQIIRHTPLTDIHAVHLFSSFTDGAACGIVIVGTILSSRYGAKIRAFKKRLLHLSHSDA